jgi:hypothetical protein
MTIPTTSPGDLLSNLAGIGHRELHDAVADLLNQLQSVYKQEASAVDITTTSYADAMTQTITTTGGDLIVWGVLGSYTLSGTPGDMYLSLRLDSGTDVELARRAGTNTDSISGIQKFTGVSAGLHTVALRSKNAAAGTQQTFWRQLMILEIGV